jgi:PAS domain S-box-containing protein
MMIRLFFYDCIKNIIIITPHKITDPIPTHASLSGVPTFLSGSGGMNERIRQFKWNESPLGPVDVWKQSLRSAIGICLNSNFPIAIYWGEQLILLYNDAWSPIPGNKHPWALGRPAKEVWPEIWNDIEPQFAKAFSGEAGGSKDAMLPMQRHGYTEECYFDFTFTPVFGEDGKVDGIFNAVIETTFRVIHERRTALLQSLSRKISSLSGPDEVFKKVNSILKENPADIPFCFIYTVSADNPEPLLVTSTHGEVLLKNLPYTDLIKNGVSVHTRDLSHFMVTIPVAYWPELPTEGLFIPFKANNGEVTGFLFAGLSARRQYDRDYHLFVESLASTISATLNTIQSLADERNRAEAINTARLRLAESESALRIAKEQLEITFKNVSASIYLFDKEGKILFLNHQAGRITRMSPAPQDLGQKDLHWIHNRILEYFDVFDEEGRVFSMQNTPALTTLRTGLTAEQVIHFVNKSDGNHQWVLANAAPLLDEQGKLKMVLATSTDITVQKLSEKKIRESEEHFRNLTQALPQLVWVTDSSGKQEFVTDRWKEYTGLDPFDAFTWSNMIHPDDAQTISEAWNFSMQTGNTYKAEARIKGKDGSYRWFHVQGEPIRDEKDKIVKWVGAFTDIHEQKLAEGLLRQSEEKLEFLVKKRTEELERSNEDLQQFAHVASHDMKEPIRKIKIYSELISEEFNEQINSQAKHYLSKIQNASDRLLVMMDGVLRYAGMDGFLQDIETIDLNNILQTVETDLEMVIQKKNAVIMRDGLPKIEGYPVLIYQLFYNLISNALKFSKTGIHPIIEVTCSQESYMNSSYFRLIVKDNGIGFEQEDAEWIFQSFARLNARENYEGTGLGLSLCKKIVDRHHGFLSAIGRPGVGAEFIILLPLVQDNAD